MNHASSAANATDNETVSDLHTIRKNNLLACYQAFAEEQVLLGHAPKGLDQSFAAVLQISPTALSSHKSGKRPIGDKLAAQFESALQKPQGWFSEEREPTGLSQAEQAFIAQALSTFRATNAEGRRRLRHLLRDFK